MYFKEYLKSFRNEYAMTQESLAHALYAFDPDTFGGIDTTTVSKWERGVTQPPVGKQVRILQFFQAHSGLPFPALHHRTTTETESIICRNGIENLIVGKKRDLVLNFPSEMMRPQDIIVSHLRSRSNMDALIEVVADIRNYNNPSLLAVSPRKLREWALHPSSLFLVSTYKEIVTGIFFLIKLKTEAFDRIVSFRQSVDSVETDDLAAPEERESHYALAFFALNALSASVLFLRYYAHIIANQNRINRIGATATLEDAKKIIANIDLEHLGTYRAENKEADAYAASIHRVLASSNVMKMIFRKEECPQ